MNVTIEAEAVAKQAIDTARVLAETVRPAKIYACVDLNGNFMSVYGKVKTFLRVPQQIAGQRRAEFVLNGGTDPKLWMIVDAQGRPDIPRDTRGVRSSSFADLPVYSDQAQAVQHLMNKEDERGNTAQDALEYGFSQYLDEPGQVMPQGELNTDGLWLLNFALFYCNKRGQDMLNSQLRHWDPRLAAAAAPLIRQGKRYLLLLSPEEQTALRQELEPLVADYKEGHPHILSRNPDSRMFDKTRKFSHDILRKNGFRHSK